jgi:hypothetical protein
MELRKILNTNKPLVLTISFGIAIAAVTVNVLRSRSAPNLQSTKQYYTDDDGTTLFADNFGKLVPFEHHGRQAVLAQVYRTQHGQQFVGWLERCSDAGVAKIHELMPQATEGSQAQEQIQQLRVQQLEVKRPGDTQWIRADSPAGLEIMKANSPDGSPVEAGVLPK